MLRAATHDWETINQQYLTAALAEIKTALQRHAATIRSNSNGEDGSKQSPEPLNKPETNDIETSQIGGRISDESFAGVDPHHTALEALCHSFGLSRFERAILLLCAGIELDSTFVPLCAAAQGDPHRTYPTFSIALTALPDAHWSALTPNAPLRRWRLIEVGAGPAMTSAPLRIDERVLHYLTGVSHLDERLAGMVEPVAPATQSDLAPSHVVIVKGIVTAWSVSRGWRGIPAVQLCSADPVDCRPIAAAAAAAMGLRAIALPMDLIPTAAAELDALLRLWERETALGGIVLLVESDSDFAAPDNVHLRGAVRLIELLDGPIILSAREPRRIAHRPTINFTLNRPTTEEQRSAWHTALPEAADRAAVDAIASQFSMGLPAIRSVVAEAAALVAVSPRLEVAATAWQACRARCRMRLDGLAQRIEPAAGWNDLVLPELQMQLLRQIAVHVRYRATVYDKWGFAAKSARGLGIAALFAGASGTGKTMAAEVLAADLELDLYRIDLASMVSKYIGETEKNLRRVFDAAEESGAILLFDEADALFGKRSEVKDSHDRYANIEVSYLLQRMEAYRGLALLTTNLKSALDTAFLRRLRFVVQFPFPDAAQRADIWRRVFPEATPLEGVDVSMLSRLNLAGGNIRNIAMNAAFLAAQAGEPVRMSHLESTARAEYAKLERPLTEAEIGGWV